MSHDCNLARVAWAVTLSQKHTQFCSPGCLCNPRTSCLLCRPIIHDQFILPACSFLSSPTKASLLLSVFPLPVVTLFLPLSFLIIFFLCEHLTPHCSLIWLLFAYANTFPQLFPNDHLSLHYLSGCSCLWLLAHFVKRLLYVLLVTSSPCGLLYPPSSPLFL